MIPGPLRITSSELALRLGAELVGSADVVLTGLESLPQASPTDLSFLRDARHADLLRATRAGAVLVTRGAIDPAQWAASQPGPALIVVSDADEAMITMLTLAAPTSVREPGVHPSAVIHPTAQVDPSASVGPHVSIGPHTRVGAGTALQAGVVLGESVVIGRQCVLRPCVVIEDRCVLGDGVVLHPGVVIGADGFGYRPAPGGAGMLKIPHIGNVVVESHVEIGANTAVDRAKFGSTRIGAGTKIDNQVQIAHNCDIGRAVIICGQCALAGSVSVGDGAVLGGGVGVSDNVNVGSRAMIGARSAVMNDVPPNETWFGYPARPVRRTFRMIAATEKLTDLLPRIRALVRDTPDSPGA